MTSLIFGIGLFGSIPSLGSLFMADFYRFSRGSIPRWESTETMAPGFGREKASSSMFKHLLIP